jgi:hypothetical protein
MINAVFERSPGVYALVGIVIVIVAGPKQLVTDIPRRGLQD